jgi:hypothetical protein
MKNNKEWPFKDAKNVMVMTTKKVMKENRTIVYVSHDADDGMWQFHDGAEVETDDAMLVSLEEVMTLDNALMKLHDLPLGWIAWRDDQDSEWNRQPENP